MFIPVNILFWSAMLLAGFIFVLYHWKRRVDAQKKEAENRIHYLDLRLSEHKEDLSIQEAKVKDLSIQLSELYDETKLLALNRSSSPSNANIPSVERKPTILISDFDDLYSKTSKELGLEYELCIGKKFEGAGFVVDYHGARLKCRDLGIDLIATKEQRVYVIQCKYWRATSVVRENTLFQLYGSMAGYATHHNLSRLNVKGLLVTSASLSSVAKYYANILGIITRSGVRMEPRLFIDKRTLDVPPPPQENRQHTSIDVLSSINDTALLNDVFENHKASTADYELLSRDIAAMLASSPADKPTRIKGDSIRYSVKRDREG